MSWRPEVQTDESGQWYPNGLRFATQEEALENASDLMGRWYLVRAFRAVESDDPVNYFWDTVDGLIPVVPTAEGE